MSRKTKIIIAIITIVALFFININKTEPIEIEQTEETDIRKPDELDKLIEKLAFCESSNNPYAINQFDGGSPSYGYLQIKSDTFWRYNQKHKVLPNLERQEVMNIIMCRDTQIALARKVILNDANGRGWRNWYNCGKRIGLQNFIKK